MPCAYRAYAFTVFDDVNAEVSAFGFNHRALDEDDKPGEL